MDNNGSGEITIARFHAGFMADGYGTVADVLDVNNAKNGHLGKTTLTVDGSLLVMKYPSTKGGSATVLIPLTNVKSLQCK